MIKSTVWSVSIFSNLLFFMFKDQFRGGLGYVPVRKHLPNIQKLYVPSQYHKITIILFDSVWFFLKMHTTPENINNIRTVP